MRPLLKLFSTVTCLQEIRQTVVEDGPSVQLLFPFTTSIYNVIRCSYMYKKWYSAFICSEERIEKAYLKFCKGFKSRMQRINKMQKRGNPRLQFSFSELGWLVKDFIYSRTLSFILPAQKLLTICDSNRKCTSFQIRMFRNTKEQNSWPVLYNCTYIYNI